MGFGFQNTLANAQESKTEDSFPFWRTLFWIETIQIVWIFVIAEQTSGKTIDPYTGGGVTSYNDGEALLLKVVPFSRFRYLKGLGFH